MVRPFMRELQLASFARGRGILVATARVNLNFCAVAGRLDKLFRDGLCTLRTTRARPAAGLGLTRQVSFGLTSTLAFSPQSKAGHYHHL